MWSAGPQRRLEGHIPAANDAVLASFVIPPLVWSGDARAAGVGVDNEGR